ncbi:MAG: LptA/OstA family protein [Armatimonadota bacterium]|nr:LptA/OstA family protein [Armatimonadota bacterium]
MNGRWSNFSGGWLVAVAAALALAAPALGQQPIAPPQGEQGRLRADRIRYDARNRVFEARGNVTLQIGDTTITCQVLVYHERTRIAWAEGGAKVVQPHTTLAAPTVKYEADPQVVHASGGVVVTQPNLTLRSQTLKYRSREQVAFAEGQVELVTEGSTLAGPSLWADLAAKRARVPGPARLVRKGGPPPRGRETDRVLAALAKEDTTITAQKLMTFEWQKTNEATAEGDVRIEQVDKKARAEKAVYSEAKDQIELVGGVRLDQVSGQWLVRERLANPPRTDEERKALESPATLTSERLVITISTRDSVATGNVRVTQAGRSATGDRGEYDDLNGKIVLTGRRVRLERDDGSWLEAEKVVVSLREDTFEAFGTVDTVFKVRP